MLATLLITRQFLQNVKEVSQPHLYSKFKRGDLSLHNLREVAHTLFRLLTQKYGVPKPHGPEPRTSARQGEPLAGHGAEAPEAPEGAAKGEKKCLNGGCGVPEEEEDDEKKDSDSEDESLLDCGLKLKKVSFIEKAERKAGDLSLEEVSFLEEGSPTMVEKGMDPASVFELCEDDEDEGDGGPSESPLKGLLEAKEMAVVMRPQRPRGSWNPVEGEEEEEEEEEENPRRKANRTSWIDPPEENYTTQLAQAEVESCMKKYEDTFQDYLEMLTQFGYVVLFSSAFPLAAMCALINNIIEIRSDAFKLCTGLQRPFGQRVESIGEWQGTIPWCPGNPLLSQPPSL
ncbi:anoctamin-8-like [Sceloporus undulatus]|uniref:anoctamin-8-like n=1 Tax=Sceloporus undulatus TaxID=8520 RepID=UPI001C4C2CBA|nr:anoctamin-8-like [Sceloporus undulatus]